MTPNYRRIREPHIADLIFLSFLLASTALAQNPGKFTATGNMTTSRFFHTATLLADGRVLITGGVTIGSSGFKTLSSAELYDPGSGTFTAAGNMTTIREEHRAILLLNGKVLITGGGVIVSGTGPIIANTFSAELYDPATATFTLTGALLHGGIPVLLRDGRVLFVGGSGTSADLYDPSTGVFTATGDMTSPWADTATLLPNGKVLITRSAPDGPPYPPFFAELYDPSTGTFAGTGSMITSHTAPTATLLNNGKVLIAGGDVGDGDGASFFAELYDPATGTFAAAANMTTGREQHTATLLPDGTVLMAGGHNTFALAATAEIYDPATSTFAATSNLAGARELDTATLLNDGGVLITGGDDERYWIPDTSLASAELYCSVSIGAACPPDSWQKAIAVMKASAGTGSLNFFQWAWYWQTTQAFPGAPSGFGAGFGSISPDVMDQTTTVGGGDPLLVVSAEQWVSYFRQVAQR